MESRYNSRSNVWNVQGEGFKKWGLSLKVSSPYFTHYLKKCLEPWIPGIHWSNTLHFRNSRFNLSLLQTTWCQIRMGWNCQLFIFHILYFLVTYLIFVFFGTPPYFLACKKYTKKVRKFTTKIASRQNSINFWLAYLVFWLAYLVFWLAYWYFGCRIQYFVGVLGFFLA